MIGRIAQPARRKVGGALLREGPGRERGCGAGETTGAREDAVLEWLCEGSCSPRPGLGPARRPRRVSSRGSAEARPPPRASLASFGLHAEGLEERAPGAEGGAAVGRWARGPGGGRAGAAFGVEGLELCAGLSEEGQGSGCGLGTDLGGKGRSRSCLGGGLSGGMGYWGHEWVRWNGSRIERGRLEGPWLLGWGGGPRKEVMNARREIDFCLERTEAEKGFEVYLELRERSRCGKWV